MWMGLLTDRINSKLEKSNLINEHALNRQPVPLSPPPPSSGKKINNPPSLLSPLPLPLIILHFTLLISHDCKTSCGLIQDDGLFGRTETMVFAKQNKTPILNMPPGLPSPETPPPPPSNWGGSIEDFGTWRKTSVRLKFNNKMLVKYWIISFWCVDTLESIVLLDLLSEYPEKNLRGMGENQQQTQTTYGVDAGIWTRVRSHRCATLALIALAFTAAPPLL